MKLVSEMLLRALRARTHHEIQFFRLVVEFMNADKKVEASPRLRRRRHHRNALKSSVDSFLPSQDLFFYLITRH